MCTEKTRMANSFNNYFSTICNRDEQINSYYPSYNTYLNNPQNKMFKFALINNVIVLDIWTEILENRGGIGVVYCDFKKAFDKVPYQHLIKSYRPTWKFTTVDKRLLLGRKQRVQVHGTLSEQHPVTSGIPQGTVLCPLLFVIFINDMPDEIVCHVSSMGRALGFQSGRPRFYSRSGLTRHIQCSADTNVHIRCTSFVIILSIYVFK